MRQKAFDNRKKKAWIVAALTVLMLCGCGNQEVSNANQSGNVVAGQDAGTSQSNGGEMEKPLYQGTHRSCILLEDEEYLYLCGSYRVSKISKATKTEEILWQNKKQASEQQQYLYQYGSALLLGDKIYFIERWYDETEQEYRALSLVHTDGSGYERIIELDWYCNDGMLLQDGLLYIDGDDKELCYQVYEDGTLSAEPEIIPALDRNQIFYDANGDRVAFEHEEISLPGDGIIVNAFNEKYLLLSDYTVGRRLYLVDRETGLEQEIGITEDIPDVLYMDDSYIYTLQRLYEKNSISYVYKRFNLKTGEWQPLFSQEKEGFGIYISQYLMDVIIKDSLIYYIDEMDGKYYLVKRNVDEPDVAEAVCDAFYDTGIGTVGYVEADYQEIYGEKNKETPIYVVGMTWMQVKESFSGANAINTYMSDYINSKIDYAQAAAKEMEEWFKPEEGLSSELSSDFTGFSYFDSRYISFCQAEYEYMSGAAHGMPYWNGFTFDLQTGKRLYLTDIINNSEEELKEIVTAYFAEMINLAPDAFWTDAVESVREWTTFESDFYLTDEGFVFFYEPYALACYAAGFQSVTIPYEEFDMKITLEKAAKVPNGEGWGLSFGERGTQPAGNVPVETLAEYDAYFIGDESEKVIYLTFDCGYENGNTEPILDALKKHDAQATFFVVGHFLESAPELVKRMTEEGHTVGSHTYHHPDITTLDKQTFQEEMESLSVKFEEVTGETLSLYYRPPEGKCSAKNMKWASELGYSTIFWSLAHVDWDTEKQPDPEEAIEKLTDRVHPGAVVLLHNTSETNGKILDELLTKWEKMEYEVRPLSELVEKRS